MRTAKVVAYTPRFYVVRAGTPSPHSYHVMDRERRNQWGEVWCESPWLTSRQATKLAASLNATIAKAEGL